MTDKPNFETVQKMVKEKYNHHISGMKNTKAVELTTNLLWDDHVLPLQNEVNLWETKYNEQCQMIDDLNETIDRQRKKIVQLEKEISLNQ